MRRLIILAGSALTLGLAVPAATITMAAVAPAVASAHDNGVGSDNDDTYRGTDCGGLYRSPFGDRALWIDCHTGKEEIREYTPPGEFTHFQVWGWYVHYRNGLISYVDWRYRYTFV